MLKQKYLIFDKTVKVGRKDFLSPMALTISKSIRSQMIDTFLSQITNLE